MTGTTYTDVGFAFYCPVLDAKDKPIRHDSCAPSRSVVMRELENIPKEVQKQRWGPSRSTEEGGS